MSSTTHRPARLLYRWLYDVQRHVSSKKVASMLAHLAELTLDLRDSTRRCVLDILHDAAKLVQVLSHHDSAAADGMANASAPKTNAYELEEVSPDAVCIYAIPRPVAGKPPTFTQQFACWLRGVHAVMHTERCARMTAYTYVLDDFLRTRARYVLMGVLRDLALLAQHLCTEDETELCLPPCLNEDDSSVDTALSDAAYDAAYDADGSSVDTVPYP